MQVAPILSGVKRVGILSSDKLRGGYMFSGGRGYKLSGGSLVLRGGGVRGAWLAVKGALVKAWIMQPTCACAGE